MISQLKLSRASKATYVTVLFISSAFISYSQSRYFAIKGGLNVSSVYDNNEKGYDTGSPKAERTGLRLGYHIGVVTNFKLSEKWVIQPELVFSNQGYSARSSYKLRYNYNYLTLPILFKRQYNKFFYHFGPQVSYLLLANRTYLGIEKKEDLAERSRYFEVGLETGAGYMLTKKISVDVRVNTGLFRIGGYQEIRNVVTQVSVFYVITKPIKNTEKPIAE
ncbi:MAG TPA: porin family protein [Cyclobacteriaceae bacterium]|nr:porin family protein [Cyclobacteriaceae bacterium]